MKESSVRDSGEKSGEKVARSSQACRERKKVEQREYIVSLNYFSQLLLPLNYFSQLLLLSTISLNFFC